MKLDILAIGAHPDDVELGCGGTLAKEIANGKKVGILDLTQGEMGTRGTPEIRAKEAAEAAKRLGAEVRENLAFEDAFIVNDKAHQFEIIKIIRKYCPEVVITNAIEDRHIDHGVASKLSSDACFLSGLRRIETSVNGQTQKAWRPKHVLHYMQWKELKPDVVVDISGFINKKLEVVKAYQSQFYDPQSKEPATPISDNNFLKSVEYRASNLGRLIFKDHAEAFNTERYPSINSVFDLV